MASGSSRPERIQFVWRRQNPEARVPPTNLRFGHEDDLQSPLYITGLDCVLNRAWLRSVRASGPEQRRVISKGGFVVALLGP